MSTPSLTSVIRDPSATPCLVDCSSSESLTSSTETATSTGFSDQKNRLGAVTYYSAIALAIVLMICVAVFSRFLYTRRLRRAYIQRMHYDAAMHAQEVEDQRRRGEADGLPGYYESQLPPQIRLPPPPPPQPTIEDLESGSTERGAHRWMFPFWMRGGGLGVPAASGRAGSRSGWRWWRREKPENPGVPLNPVSERQQPGEQEGVLVDHRTGMVTVVMDPPVYAKEPPTYDATPAYVPSAEAQRHSSGARDGDEEVAGESSAEASRRVSGSEQNGNKDTGVLSTPEGREEGAQGEREDEEREREQRELQEYERRSRGL